MRQACTTQRAVVRCLTHRIAFCLDTSPGMQRIASVGTQHSRLPASLLYRRRLVGMIVSPLCWKNSEWVGLTVGCSASELLGSLRRRVRRADFRLSDFRLERSAHGELCAEDGGRGQVLRCSASDMFDRR